jgi:hypothetical protein
MLVSEVLTTNISQPQELHRLQETGVTQIELKYKANKSYKDAYGNTFQFEGQVSVISQDGQMKQKEQKRQAWDVVLNASDTPPGGIQPNVVCSLTPKYPPIWDVGSVIDEAVPVAVFASQNLVCALTTN